MFSVEISSPRILVSSRLHRYTFSIDESAPNPLEATYAALAGCAGVYALKAAKKLGKDPAGIKITGRPYNRTDNPLFPNKWVTTVTFPEDWTQQERDAVTREIAGCAVKELITNGAGIEFVLA